jgi:integrase
MAKGRTSRTGWAPPSGVALGITPHALRHTFASVAGDPGFSELTIAGLLGHTGRGVTQRYVHLDKALLTVADNVAEEIAQALDAGAIGGREKPTNRVSGGGERHALVA